MIARLRCNNDCPLESYVPDLKMSDEIWRRLAAGCGAAWSVLAALERL